MKSSLPLHILRAKSGRVLRYQRGMSLVEWMVSMTIGLIVLGALTALIARQSGAQAELEKSSRQIENGRYAMQVLSDDIQMAGYFGEFSNVGVAPPSTTNPCSLVIADIEALMVFPIQGFDSPSTMTGLLSCINPANHVPGTDLLVVRRVEPATVAVGSGSASVVYLQSGLTPSGQAFTKKLGLGPGDATAFNLLKKDGVSPALLRRFVVHIYYVSPCSVPVSTNCTSAADGGKPIPTLKVLELSASGGATAFSSTPLVEGIENMQVEYGLDTSGDGAVDGLFVANPIDALAPADRTKDKWPDVMAVRVHLLARNNESTAGYLDNKSYAMGVDSASLAQVITPSTDAYGNNVQAYKRRLFSQLIRVVNPSSRREQ